MRRAKGCRAGPGQASLAPCGSAGVTAPMCGMTRLLVVGFVLGTLVATLTGNDAAGWVAALVGVAVVAAVQQVRGTRASCAVERPASRR